MGSPGEYFRALDAPLKGLYQFDESAHSPIFEQSAQVHRFRQVDVLTSRNTLADHR